MVVGIDPRMGYAPMDNNLRPIIGEESEDKNIAVNKYSNTGKNRKRDLEIPVSDEDKLVFYCGEHEMVTPVCW